MLKGGKVKYNIKGLKIEGILTFPLTFRQVVNFFLRRRPYFALMFLFFDIDHSITPEKAQFSLSLKGQDIRIKLRSVKLGSLVSTNSLPD
jgi:hypothetical protein